MKNALLKVVLDEWEEKIQKSIKEILSSLPEDKIKKDNNILGQEIQSADCIESLDEVLTAMKILNELLTQK